MRIYRRVVTSLIALGVVLAPRAQVAPATSVGAVKETEAVVLSPFEVNASADVGYQAGNTTSGSRLNAKLKDTAAPITPFTPEFLSDFALTNIEEMMSYSANFERDFEDSNAGFNAPSLRGTSAATPPFRVRGLIGAFAVDLIESAVPQDNYNIDRVEVSSGPNSVLFGLGAAGGTVSLTSKQANLNRDRTSLRATFGSWNFERYEADWNTVLIPKKLALRLNGLEFKREGWRNYDYEESRRLAAAVTYKPFRHTLVRAAWDAGEHGRHTDWPWTAADGLKAWLEAGKPVKDGFTAGTGPGTDAALGINRVATTARWTFMDNSGATFNLQNELQSFVGTGRATDALLTPNEMPAEYSFSGPGSRLSGFYRNYSAKFEQKIGDNLVIEGAYLHTYNKSEANGWAVPGNAITLRGDPNLTIPAVNGGTVPNPYAGQLYLENTWRPEDTAFANDVFRLTGAYELGLGKFGRHRLAGLLETGQIEQTRHIGQEILVNQSGVPVANATPENAANQVFRRHYTAMGDFNNYFQSNPEIPLNSFPSGPNTLASRYVALNENGNANDLKLTDTMMIAAQSYFWKDRFITTVGYRADTVKFKNGVTTRLAATDPLVKSGQKISGEWNIVPGQYVSTTFKPTTFTAGAVLHVTQRFSVFYNQSNNVGAPSFTARILPPASPPAYLLPEMTDGESHDYGFMIDVLGDDKYFIRATAFDSVYLGSTPIQPGTNPYQPSQALGVSLDALVAAGRLTPAAADAWRVNPGAFSIDVASQGYEVELIANPNPNLTLRAAFSYSARDRENFFAERDPYTTNLKAFLATVDSTGVPVTINGVTRTAVDTINEEIDTFIEDTGTNQLQPFSSRPYKFTLNGRYRFTTGPLKGLAAGGAVRWQSDNYMQRDNRTTVNGVANPDLGKEYWGNLFEAWDFFASYRTRLPFTKQSLTLQVNVRNAFNQCRVQPAKYTNDFTALRRVYLNEPRSWRFSASMDF